MPIKPENKARYPKNWKEIRVLILERAGHKCEKCQAPNRTTIARGAGDDAGTYMLNNGEVYCADTGKYLGAWVLKHYNILHMTDVVLTIAHLDHTPENCEPENLRAWCQRCHLDYDKYHHAANAQATRKAKLAVGDLFAPCFFDTMGESDRLEILAKQG